MEREIYLLWDPLNRWGIYSQLTVPDTHNFPNYFYKRYPVSEGVYKKVFYNLLLKLGNLKDIIPSKENEKEIFPKLVDLVN